MSHSPQHKQQQLQQAMRKQDTATCNEDTRPDEDDNGNWKRWLVTERASKRSRPSGLLDDYPVDPLVENFMLWPTDLDNSSNNNAGSLPSNRSDDWSIAPTPQTSAGSSASQIRLTRPTE